MDKTLGAFRAALPIGWIALSAAGLLYARVRDIPMWAAVPVLAAFLVEYPFYLLPGFAGLRERIGARVLPYVLVASAVLPYLVYAAGTGQFRWLAFAQLLCLAVALSLWYAVLPAAAITDIAYIVLLAAVLLGHYFDRIYTPPYPGVTASFLGHLALIQIAAMALLVQRRAGDPRYGFWPDAREWREGALHFLFFLPVGIPLGLWLKVMRTGPPDAWWKIAGTFFGILWVVALSEEFFFRGFLQRRIGDWTGNRQAALILTSLLFGAVHLPFRGFPNWRFALLAAVAGWFYGRAFDRTGSIRTSMVTHALVVTTWKGFFS